MFDSQSQFVQHLQEPQQRSHVRLAPVHIAPTAILDKATPSATEENYKVIMEEVSPDRVARRKHTVRNVPDQEVKHEHSRGSAAQGYVLHGDSNGNVTYVGKLWSPASLSASKKHPRLITARGEQDRVSGEKQHRLKMMEVAQSPRHPRIWAADQPTQPANPVSIKSRGCQSTYSFNFPLDTLQQPRPNQYSKPPTPHKVDTDPSLLNCHKIWFAFWTP